MHEGTWLHSASPLLSFFYRKVGCLWGKGAVQLGDVSSSWLVYGWRGNPEDRIFMVYGRLGIKKHCSVSMWVLWHQSRPTFQHHLTEQFPANFSDSLSPKVLAAWPLYCFPPKRAQSRQAEELSFSMLACFYWVCETFFQMLVCCQVSCGYPYCLPGIALSLLQFVVLIPEVLQSLWKNSLSKIFKISG